MADALLIIQPSSTFVTPVGQSDARGLVTPVWDDLRFPAQGINPAGAIDAPTVDTTLTAFPGTLLFAGNAENVIAGIAQMPHAWAKGTPIRPHIHWAKTTGSASAISWVFYYRHLGFAGDTPPPGSALSLEPSPSVIKPSLITTASPPSAKSL